MAGDPPKDSNTPLRRFVRKPVAAQLRCNSGASPGFLFFDTQDLSVGGAFLRADLLLEQGEELDVEFSLPGDERVLRAHARVAWVRRADSETASSGMGLEFVNLSGADRDALATFLEES
jgi:uncharacterized protein (TIGR02266 family)